MARFRIELGDRQFELPSGEVLVGRDEVCQVRFADGSVSRRHLRLLRVGDRIIASDLESRNGTYVNEQRLLAPLELSDGDRVRVGDEVFCLRRVNPLPELIAQPGTQPALVAIGIEDYSQPRYRSCRSCRALVAEEATHCPSCHGDTQVLYRTSRAGRGVRRAHDRHGADLSALYVSATLTFDAPLADVSRSGLFLVTELIDPVGTMADVVLFTAELGGARFGCEVIRAIEHAEGEPQPGMGLRFTSMASDASRWLDNLLRSCSGRG